MDNFNKINKDKRKDKIYMKRNLNNNQAYQQPLI